MDSISIGIPSSLRNAQGVTFCPVIIIQARVEEANVGSRGTSENFEQKGRFMVELNDVYKLTGRTRPESMIRSQTQAINILHRY
jgi:hypothetical protein